MAPLSLVSFRIALLAVFLFLFSVAPPAARAQDSGDAFTVSDVTVDVTAENAIAARTKAFEQAQEKAITELAARLLPDDKAEGFKAPPVKKISAMVSDFEVTNEKLSTVRYIGTYTFRFKKDAVRGLLGGQGLAFSDVGSKPALVLPFYQQGGETVLWGDNNPWLAAWTKKGVSHGLVPVAVPIGDLDDVSDIGDHEALSFEAENLERMKERYRAGDAFVVIAIPGWSDPAAGMSTMPDNVQVIIYQTAAGTAQLTRSITVNTEDVTGEQTVFDAAVQAAIKNFQSDWKTKKAVSTDAPGSRLKARARFTGMQEWIELQRKLSYAQGVSDVQLLSLRPGGATVEFRFAGGEERLRLALAQADITLSAPKADFTQEQGQPQMQQIQPAAGEGGGYPVYIPYGTPAIPGTALSASPLVYEIFLTRSAFARGGAY